jgi:hypothetical protein
VAEATPLDARDLAALRREIADLAARLIETPDIPPRERDAAGAKRAL